MAIVPIVCNRFHLHSPEMNVEIYENNGSQFGLYSLYGKDCKR